jgi:hypothetical protein
MPNALPRLRIAHLLELTCWVALAAAAARNSVAWFVLVVPLAICLRVLWLDLNDASWKSVAIVCLIGAGAGFLFWLPAWLTGHFEPGDAPGVALALTTLGLWVGTAVGIVYRAIGAAIANETATDNSQPSGGSR